MVSSEAVHTLNYNATSILEACNQPSIGIATFLQVAGFEVLCNAK